MAAVVVAAEAANKRDGSAKATAAVGTGGGGAGAGRGTAGSATTTDNINNNNNTNNSSSNKSDPWDPPPVPDGVSVMPLVQYLAPTPDHPQKANAGWHRNTERRARGMFPVASLSSQLEPWERQLVRIYYVI